MKLVTPLIAPTANSTEEQSTKAPLRIHKRAVLLGAVLVLLLSYVVLYVDLVVKQLPMGVLQFAPGAVGSFLIVYALLQGARKLKWFSWINAADLLVLYVMMFVGVFVCTRGLIEKLIPAIAYINANALPVNNYQGLFFSHLNPALVVGNPAGAPQQHAATAYFNALGRDALPWNAWIVPCACWFVLFALILVCFVSLASLLRRQWAESERLAFPHTVLPLQILDENNSQQFWRNSMTWFGIAIPFVIYGINGIHQSFPTIPEIPLTLPNIQSYFTTPPWNNIQGTSIFLSFAALGFAYLLPTDLLFSLWFFFLLTRLGDVVGASMGLDLPGMPSYPTRAYIGYQAAGAYVALAFIYAYSGRHLFRKTMREVFRFETSTENENELLPPRIAFWSMVTAFVGILAWSVWAGMSLWLAAAVWLIYLFVTCIVLSRGVSEAGLLMTETSFRPGDIVNLFVAKASWSPSSVVTLSLFNAVFFRDLRGLFLALFMDAGQIAGGVNVRRRSLLMPISIAVVLAFIVGVATHLRLSYDHGAVSLYNYGIANAGWAFDDASSTLRHAEQPFPSARAWFATGMIVVGVLTKLRTEFVWFPLNPLAYALAPTWTMVVLWFPIFVMWVTKSLILRYGGTKLYAQARPFFLGLIIGEFGSAALWAILASAFGVAAPSLPLP